MDGGRATAPHVPGPVAMRDTECPICGLSVVVAKGRETCPAGCGWRPAAPRLEMGRLLATPGALAAMTRARVAPTELLARHVRGGWGDVDAEDWQANDWALRHGERLLSAYRLPTGTKVWIITEWDRSATTMLLPEDY